MRQILQIWHLSRQKQIEEKYFQHLFDLSLLQRKSGYGGRAIISLLVPAESFLKGTRSCTTGKVSWFSKVWAQHIPGLASQPAGGSHPAAGPHAAAEWRMLDGE